MGLKHIVIFASGSGTNAENIVTYFKNKGTAMTDLIAVNKATADVLARAERLKIPTLVFRKSDLESGNLLKNPAIKAADLIILAGFLLKIPLAFIKAFPNKIINIHPALLPKYGGKGMYGSYVHQSVIANKEKESGITIHYVNENYDEGAIVFQKSFALDADETPHTLASKIHQLEQANFPQVIENLLFNNSTVHIYTDGACSGNPGKGGYGIVMEWVGKPYKKEFSAGFKHTTNNRMELLAVIVALEKLKTEQTDVMVFSDSKYVVDAVEKKWVFGWQRKGFKDKKNVDLWKRFLKISPKHKVKFIWIKGHNDHPQNERCDRLAVAASQQEKLLIDKGFEQKPDTLF